MSKITIIHAPTTTVDIIKEVSIYAPNNYAYFISDNKDFLNFVKSNYDSEKEVSDWIRKYDNVLQGLKYWKDKALSKG